MTKPKGDPAKKGNCYFCNRECTDDSYCFGCHHFICSSCDKPGGQWGVHSVEEHKEKS